MIEISIKYFNSFIMQINLQNRHNQYIWEFSFIYYYYEYIKQP